MNTSIAEPLPAEASETPPRDAPRPHRALVVDTLADSVVILLALTLLQRLLGFVRGVLFCRWLSPQELGEWEMCFSFLMLAAPLAIFSLPGAFGRYLEFFRIRGQYRLFIRR
ncbi:MAG TPA: lipopolysaccharide biosynthesis protein, partial [Pirellulales bacterium]|nr:lipopolysaccharide biosynthesis protein [Pirellulales bacterium]